MMRKRSILQYMQKLVALTGLFLLLGMAGSVKAADAPVIPATRPELLAAINQTLTAQFGAPTSLLALPSAGMNEEMCRLQYKAVGIDTEALSRLLYYHLRTADQLLTGQDMAKAQMGIGMAAAAASCAETRLKNPVLAARIYHAYVIPCLSVADTRSWQHLSQEDLLRSAIEATAEAGTWVNLVPLYQQLIQTTKEANTADGARIRLLDLQRRLERYGDAIQTIGAITDNKIRNDFAGLRETLIKLRDAQQAK